MKLIFCSRCQDVVRLQSNMRTCDCGTCGGRYINSLDVIYWGPGVMPLGFDNGSFAKAVNAQPDKGRGADFDAFVIPKECKTMIRLDKHNAVTKQETDNHENQACSRAPDVAVDAPDTSSIGPSAPVEAG